MRLRPTRVDCVTLPGHGAVGVDLLFHPVQTDPMAASPNHVRVAVRIDIENKDRQATIAVEGKIWMPDPAVTPGVGGCFKPSARASTVIWPF